MNANQEFLFNTRLLVKRDVQVDVICKQCRKNLGRGMLYQVMQEYPIEITCSECWPLPVRREELHAHYAGPRRRALCAGAKKRRVQAA